MNPTSATVEQPGGLAGPARWVVVGLEVFVIVGAVVGFVGLLTQGSAFFGGTVVESEVPFSSWTVAAVALLVLNGAVPSVAVAAELTRRQWARRAHQIVAAILVVWIAAQVALIGLVFVLQPLIFVIGVIIGVLASLPGTRPTAADRSG